MTITGIIKDILNFQIKKKKKLDKSGFFCWMWGVTVGSNNYAFQLKLNVLGAIQPKKASPFVSNLEIFYIYFH